MRDVEVLKGTNPNVYHRTCQGLFTINKTGWKFLSIGLDKDHKRLNEPVKGDDGGAGLTEDPIKLRRWIIAGLTQPV